MMEESVVLPPPEGKIFWSYLTVASKMYDIPLPRLKQAIEEGKVRSKEVKNPHYRSGPMATVVLKADIERNLETLRRSGLEALEHTKATKRAQAAAEERRRKTLAYVEGMRIQVAHKGISIEQLTRLAVSHYNDLWAERGKWEKVATENDSPQFLMRIMVNFLRHEATSYDDELVALFGATGAEEARAKMRERVLGAIAEAFPVLREECETQARRAP